MNTKRLAMGSMLSAMCAVLGYLSIDMGNIKISFESLPILLSAMLFGPIDGLFVGGIGTALYQFLRYGVSITTPLWMMPYMLCGLFSGFYAKSRHFRLNKREYIGIVSICELMVTLLNTGVLYIDSRIYGYYSTVFVFGTLILRLAVCAARAVAFGVLLPVLIEALNKSKIVTKQGGALK